MKGKRRALAERHAIVGYSQESLARFVGVEVTTVGRWERGETSPQPVARRKLCEALGVSPERLDTPTGRALHTVLAELGQLCGWTSYDAGNHPLAQRYWIAALRATHTADDRVLGAHILSCLAEQAARQGQPAEAVTLLDTALAGTRGRHTPALLAELYGRQAYAYATLNDSSGTAAAEIIETLDSSAASPCSATSPSRWPRTPRSPPSATTSPARTTCCGTEPRTVSSLPTDN